MNIYELITNYKDTQILLKQADENFKAMGYTEQGILHAQYTAEIVYNILSKLKFPQKDIDIAMTAGYLHDVGCCISYKGHDQNGAFVANKILTKINIPLKEKLTILSIIGSHEDTIIYPISELSAAVVLADKTDVRRQRVIKTDFKYFDQYDRVHYAVVENKLEVFDKEKVVRFSLIIDENICSVLEYFELFLSRIDFCKKAASKLGLQFELYINKVKYL